MPDSQRRGVRMRQVFKKKLGCPTRRRKKCEVICIASRSVRRSRSLCSACHSTSVTSRYELLEFPGRFFNG
jgi:hypothetical protein